MASNHRAKLDIDAPLQIAEGLDVLLLSDDEVLIQYGTRSTPSELLRDTDLKGLLGKTIGHLLGGPVTLSELLYGVRAADHEDVYQLVDDLLQRGILADARTDPVDQYLRYTFEGEATLLSRSVALLGAGPLGSRIAHSLLQHGIGRVVLLDDRPVDDLWYRFSSLGLAPREQVAGPAHVVLRDLLQAAGHHGVDSLDAQLDLAGIQAAIENAEFVIVAFEQPNIRLAHLVNRLCLQARKPWILATIDGNLGLVGPLFLPVHTACYNDYATLSQAGGLNQMMARKHRQHMQRRGTGSFFPGLPTYAEIVAGYTALAVVNFLLLDASFALGRVMAIDFDRMLIDVEDVLKLPRCPVCGASKSPYQPPFSSDIVSRS